MCVFLVYIFYLFIHLCIFGCAGPSWLHGFFSLVGASGVYSLAVALGLLIAMTSLGEHRL